MNRWAGKLAVVTGASAGIGEAISRSLVKSGVNVLGLARREDRLQQLKEEFNVSEDSKGLFYYMKCDVRKEEDILKAFEFVENEFGGVDILINNAGTLKYSGYEECKMEDFRTIMDINVVASAACISETLKSMRKHKIEGHIININSITGLNAQIIPLPINIYPASKFAMRGMADALRQELIQAKDNIRLTSIYPGVVKTELIGLAGFDETMIFSIMPSLASEDIADTVVYALAAPPHVQIEELVITPLHSTE